MRRRLERRIAEYGMKRADAIIAQTKDQAALLKAEYGLQAAAIVRNFHPVPDDDSPRRSADKLRVIWVANFKEWKHPELFVALAEALRDRSDVEFVMIGRPGTKAFAELHERMERLENLRYLGELHIDRVNEEISASHLFVNTSSSEGFANTFIQAWLRSVPVISCFVDPDECLSKGGAGLVAGSLEGLIAAVTDLADHRDKLERLAASARAYGYANHRPEQATALLDLLAGKPLQPG